MQAAEYESVLAVQSYEVGRALSRVHLVRNAQSPNARTFIQTQRHLRRAIGTKPKIFRPTLTRKVDAKIVIKTKEPALLQVTEGLSARRIAALVEHAVLLTIVG